MSGYANDDFVDPAKPYLAALEDFGHLIQIRGQVEDSLRRHYEDLVLKYRAKCEECDRERRNAVLWEKEQRLAEKELMTLKSFAEATTFAFVVIDGDGAVFREDLIAKGEEGGGEAAHELYAALKLHLQETYNVSHLEMYVQVVLNIDGLSRALFTSGILRGTEDRSILYRFARGFCRAQPLFSFVDIGYGKEQADNKVRKAFEMMEKNIHCRALILGGCHDNGYATFLESFRNNHKVGLLETTPAAAGFRKLPFKTFSVPTVFRSEPLPQPKLAGPPGFSIPTLAQTYQMTPPLSTTSVSSSPKSKPSTPIMVPGRVEVKKENDVRANSWASVGRLGSSPQVIDISTQKKAPAKERAFYQLNKKDQRVDVAIPRVDTTTQEAFNERVRKNGANYCNRYHLLGSCKAIEFGGNCPYVHGDRLSAQDQNVLRLRARGLPCGSGSLCHDVFCTSGHHCMNPKNCWFDEACRFADSHGMDTVPTIKVYEDGTREVVL